MADGKSPIVPLRANKVDYLLPGGERIRRFLGEGPDASLSSQLWVASLVTSALEPGSQVGLSRLRESGQLLRDWLAENPEERLGAAHWRRYGLDLGFLLKLLDSSSRLLIQTHPDDEKARRYFGLPSGKTEAWYVLEADPDACVWVGFKPGVTPEGFRRLIEQQDTHALLDCLHRLPVRRGDVVFLPAGTVHALGSGALVAEIQQPVDITLRAEYIRPDGSRLPPESLHSGAGMDALLDCFTFDCLPWAGMRARYAPEPPPLDAAWVRRLIGAPLTDLFALDEICLPTGGCRRAADGFRVALVCAGSALLRWQDGCLPVRQGDELFIPASVRDYRYENARDLRVLECSPPAP